MHNPDELLAVARLAAELYCDNDRCGGECDVCQLRYRARAVLARRVIAAHEKAKAASEETAS